jgi:DNA polymerase III alpha subunit (gram-positive type)
LSILKQLVQIRDNMKFPKFQSFVSLEATGRKRHELNAELNYSTHSKLKMIPEVHEFLLKDGLTAEHRCLIAHNASFDRRFMHALWAKVKLILPVNFWLDTMKIARREMKKEGTKRPKVTLQATMEKFGVTSLGQAHRAKFDAQNLYQLFKKIKDDGIDYLENIERHEHEV